MDVSSSAPAPRGALFSGVEGAIAGNIVQAAADLVWSPVLRKLMGSFDVTGFVKIRPIDLFITKSVQQHGVVLVGDAFASSCPAAGTGARKALVDAERLCNVLIPRWLATPGRGEDKIAMFYDDPVKRACDEYCVDKAFGLRAFTLDTSPVGIAKRWIKFGLHWGKGTLRSLAAPTPSTVVHDDEEQAPKLAPAAIRNGLELRVCEKGSTSRRT